MKPTHVVQLVLACVVAGGGAAVPLLVSPMTPTAWILLAVAEAAAISKALSVQSEIAGDKGAPADVGAKLDAVAKAASKIAPLACLLLLSGCLSSAPIVPVTPANTAQIASCQSSAAAHNGVVIGGFVLGGIGAGLGSAGAVVSDTQTKTDLAIGAAIAGGLAVIDSAIVGFSAQNFANGNCTSVVGALPVSPLGTTTVKAAAP